MFKVYDNKELITSNPISYNFLLKLFQGKHFMIDWNKISTLPDGHAYSYQEFMIVRVN